MRESNGDLVFICSPYRPEQKACYLQEYEEELNQNIDLAKKACRFAYEKGMVPMAPHLYFTQFLNDGCSEQRYDGIEMGLAWIRRCNELWVFGDHISSGMAEEIYHAREVGVPIMIKQIEKEPNDGRAKDNE